MARNVTIKLDEDLIKLCRFEAVEQDKSLSQWIADTLATHLKDIEAYRSARERARARIQEGMHLGGTYSSRDEIHERQRK